MAAGDGLVVVVTGASSGIGRATAVNFAKSAAHLVLVARGKDSLQDAADECLQAGAGSADVEVCDVNDAAGIARVFTAAERRYGRIDVVVHAAAVMAYGTIEQLPSEIYRQVVDTTIHGTANVARCTLGVFRRQERGKLIVVNSLLGAVTAPQMGAYVTAKWGQRGLIRVLQQETRDAPAISITAVAPGGVNTPIYYQAANVIGREGRPPPPAYSPERVAGVIAGQVKRSRRVVQAGLLNPVLIAGFQLLPGAYDRLVGPLLNVLGISQKTIPATEGNVFHPQPRGDETAGRWRAI